MCVYLSIYLTYARNCACTQPACIALFVPSPPVGQHQAAIRNWALASAVWPQMCNFLRFDHSFRSTLPLSHPTTAFGNFTSGDAVGTAGIRFGNDAFIWRKPQLHFCHRNPQTISLWSSNIKDPPRRFAGNAQIQREEMQNSKRGPANKIGRNGSQRFWVLALVIFGYLWSS